MAVAETINKTMIPVTRKFACSCPSFLETCLRPALSSTYPRTLRERWTTPGNRLNSLKHHRLWPSLGANLHQALGHQNQPQDLGPLGNDVANHLSPFTVRVHSLECHYPGDARDQKKQSERVLAQPFHCRRPHFAFRLLALGGALFVEVLGHYNGYQD